MRVRIVVPLVLVLAAIGARTTAAAPCPPLACGPAAQSVAGGTALAVTFGTDKPLSLYDLRRGELRNVLARAVVSPDGTRVVSQSGRTVTTTVLATAVESKADAPAGWSVVGTSADGRRAVLSRSVDSTTSFAVGAARVTLPGRFDFDGLLRNRLYLIEEQRDGYLVRVASLATGKLAAQPLKDADESALIQGQAWSRVASPDGRYVFTLYIAGAGHAMIHVLDMERGTARCIDLPGSGNYIGAASYALALSRDSKRLYAAGSGYGYVVTVDVARQAILRKVAISRVAPPGPVLPSASLSPGGKTLAFAANTRLWLYDVRRGRVVRRATLPVEGAVSYDARGRLWAVGRTGALLPVPSA